MCIAIRYFASGSNFSLVGCVDKTHIPILAPKGNEKAYLNRKHYHSVNLMVNDFLILIFRNVYLFVVIINLFLFANSNFIKQIQGQIITLVIHVFVLSHNGTAYNIIKTFSVGGEQRQLSDHTYRCRMATHCE